MPGINLLIIEDEPAQIQMYGDVIGQFNKKNDIQFSYTLCKTFNEGVDALKSPTFDAAIIDLKLSNSEKLEGRDLVIAVYQKIRIPVFVYSGSIAQIDDIPENVLLRKKLRTETLTTILEEIVGIYKTGITTFLRPGGIIDQKLTEIFWMHLSKDLDVWIKYNNQETLLRYILAHFQEYLEIDTDGDFQEYHPNEIYICPPIRKNLHTGDLIKIEGLHYLILTPACDIVFNYKTDGKGETIAKRNADKMLLVSSVEFDQKKLCLNKDGKLDKSSLTKYIKNGSFQYHYLPPFKGNSGFLLDFQHLKSVDFSTPYERIATISSPFIKDIISRFSNYYSRQGQPTFSQDELIADFLKKG
jgi:hypothetical protein